MLSSSVGFGVTVFGFLIVKVLLMMGKLVEGGGVSGVKSDTLEDNVVNV